MTLRSSLILVVALVLLATCVSSELVGTITGHIKLPNGQPVHLISKMQPRPFSTITLHSPTLTLRTVGNDNGVFVLHQVPEGVYLLTVEFAHLVFPSIRVSVIPSRSGQLRIRALVNDGTQAVIDADGTAENPIPIVALGRHAYFVPREEINVLSFFKNPMIIMMVVSVGMMGLMKLVPQDELRQQMKDMNQQVQQSKEQLGLEKKSS
jgi:hypothetical protein